MSTTYAIDTISDRLLRNCFEYISPDVATLWVTTLALESPSSLLLIVSSIVRGISTGESLNLLRGGRRSVGTDYKAVNVVAVADDTQHFLRGSGPDGLCNVPDDDDDDNSDDDDENSDDDGENSDDDGGGVTFPVCIGYV
ncbi:hypothetical protein Tco_1114626 [Tanacetum coccineum]|uniref:Uncharacterized protein n=1 Tax=Tanacetum coccineum TaxID=301880 RepID=A0ABQ5IYA6_9ASTR